MRRLVRAAALVIGLSVAVVLAVYGPKSPLVCPVLRVVDGDTVVVRLNARETTIRLVGVDTPETVHPNKPVEAFGKQASAFTHELLDGRTVRVVFPPDHERQDRYGRTLAYLYRQPDGLFVNLEIVKQGYGHAYTRFPFDQMEAFRAAEGEARAARRGLWADQEPVEASGPTVHITPSGNKYHRAGCPSAGRNPQAVPLSQALAEGYQPCARCAPPRAGQ